MNNQPATLDIPARTIVRIILIILAFILAWKIRSIIISLITAFILMTGFALLADWFHSKGVNRTLSAILSYILSIIVLAFIIFLIVPPLIVQVKDFVRSLPVYIDQFYEFYTNTDIPFVDNQNLGNLISSRVEASLENILHFLFSTINGLVNFLTIAILSFYLLLERDKIKNNVFILFPHLPKERVTKLAHKIEEKIGAWLRGEIILMITVGVLTYIGLTLLQIDYALPLAVIAGLLEAVPVIGPIISAVPAILVSLVSANPFSAVGVLFLYTAIQQIENNLLVPKIMESAVGLSPLVTILALLIGATIFGLPGAIIAVPVATIIQVIVSDLWKNGNKI